MIVAYAYEPESYVIGRAVEHAQLTHRSITVTAVISVLVPLLLELFHGSELLPALDRAMAKMRPPRITGRQLRDSYVSNHGPGNIPAKEKWGQHMNLAPEGETLYELIHELCRTNVDDEFVAGWSDQGQARFSTACYCEHAFPIVLYLAYKYGPSNPERALLQNVMLGGHSTARGAILGAILGAAHGTASIPFRADLAAPSAIQQEIEKLVSTVVVQ
jgi:ADP-ribosylglycohydrolase